MSQHYLIGTPPSCTILFPFWANFRWVNLWLYVIVITMMHYKYQKTKKLVMPHYFNASYKASTGTRKPSIIIKKQKQSSSHYFNKRWETRTWIIKPTRIKDGVQDDVRQTRIGYITKKAETNFKIHQRLIHWVCRTRERYSPSAQIGNIFL